MEMILADQKRREKDELAAVYNLAVDRGWHDIASACLKVATVERPESERRRIIAEMGLAGGVTPRDLIRDLRLAVADAYCVSPEDLEGPGRLPLVVRARQHFWYLLRQRGLSYPQIGKIARRDHGTVLRGVHRHRSRKVVAREI